MKVAIISGKGGSGKSSVSAALIDLAKKVVAVDCDVDASNLPLLFSPEEISRESFVSGQHIRIDAERCIGCGRCAEHCTFGALRLDAEGRLAGNDFLCEGCGFCERLCPADAIHVEESAGSDILVSDFPHGELVHGRLRPGDDNSGKMIARMRKIADERMESGHFPVQILDGPPGIGCPVMSTVTGMDKVVIVCEPTLSGLSDLKRAYTVASSFCQDILVIINKADINEENRNGILHLCAVLQIPVIAELPFDRRLIEAQLHCRSIVSYAPESVCAHRLESAYRRIFGWGVLSFNLKQK